MTRACRPLLPALCAFGLAACGSSASSTGEGTGGAPSHDGGIASNGGGSNGGGSNGGGSNGGGASSGGSSNGGPCSFSVAPAVPAPAAPGASPEQQANAAELRSLDFLVGRFLRGDVAVYRGTARAKDNASVLANTEVYGPRPDGEIPQGPAIALLEVREASGGDWNPPRQGTQGASAYLVVHGLPADRHVIFEQPASTPGLTEVSLLSGIATTASLVTSCTDCGPQLLGVPPTIAFTDLTAAGTVSVFMGYAGQGGGYVDVTAQVVASVDLEKAPICSLQFDDLVVLDSATGPNQIDATMSSFSRVGGEMIRQSGGSVTVGGAEPCPLVQSYTMDVFIDLADLGHYGIRNFQTGAPAEQCHPVTP